jgi:hypothetical protein
MKDLMELVLASEDNVNEDAWNSPVDDEYVIEDKRGFRVVTHAGYVQHLHNACKHWFWLVLDSQVIVAPNNDQYVVVHGRLVVPGKGIFDSWGNSTFCHDALNDSGRSSWFNGGMPNGQGYGFQAAHYIKQAETNAFSRAAFRAGIKATGAVAEPEMTILPPPGVYLPMAPPMGSTGQAPPQSPINMPMGAPAQLPMAPQMDAPMQPPMQPEMPGVPQMPAQQSMPPAAPQMPMQGPPPTNIQLGGDPGSAPLDPSQAEALRVKAASKQLDLSQVAQERFGKSVEQLTRSEANDLYQSM